MDKEKNEVEKFFEELPTQDRPVVDDLFGEKKEEVKAEEPEKEESETPKNRYERRLKAKLERERESAIALNERVKKLSEEVKSFKSNSAASTDERLLRIFGDNETGKELAKHFTNILSEVKGEAKQEAIAELEQVKIREKEEVKTQEEFLDKEFEAIEDTYGVDITSSNAKAVKTRNEFIDFVQEISPKDENGDITEYADIDTAFKVFQSLQTKPESRNKELAARSMQQSKSSDSGKENTDALERYLNENGIRTRLR